MSDLLKKHRRPREFNSIVSPGVRNNYQMDVIVYNRYKWKRYKYILCVIVVVGLSTKGLFRL